MASKSLSTDQIKGKLLQGAFTSSTPSASRLSDPIVETPMLVTLDQLRPYEHNPRVNRNPQYEEIRESIQNRGLDAPPPITRRPGEDHFIIRNGGNTRLAILNDLWRETQDDRFFRLHCLFRPWPTRGEIVALTGHLAESDLHGGLTFIERALGVERARNFYQEESGTMLSQRELAKRLREDGYPISQSHICKMQDAIRYLLPAIPNALYGGLGKPQIERLTVLRRLSEKAWLKYDGALIQDVNHEQLFQETLSLFDHGEFGYERFQDELLHRMGEHLAQDYNRLRVDILDPDSHSSTPTPADLTNSTTEPETSTQATASPLKAPQTSREKIPVVESTAPQTDNAEGVPHPEKLPLPLHEQELQERIQANTLSPIAGLTPRTQAIKHQLAQATGEEIPLFEESCLHSIPIQAGGLHPVADLWYIERAVDVPEALRSDILALVHDIADELAMPQHHFIQSDWGIGFVVVRPPDWDSDIFARPPAQITQQAFTVLNLLDGISGRFAPALDWLRSEENTASGPEMNNLRFIAELGQVLLGDSPLKAQSASVSERLSDVALVKLFRVIRLARRLIELESTQSSCDDI
ncbi:ParB family protein [Pseudomonas sp. MF6754]|uniref:ParB family protein n=1 Tax=Pseudomonas sp. MF6754 TaxID=2797529 RepID=UPI00190DD3ED|nr:ParB family protein [Pseudomonas sp. MF6754]MBK3453276.1 ParB family protein [Pseudomonas sp. MF6754]